VRFPRLVDVGRGGLNDAAETLEVARGPAEELLERGSKQGDLAVVAVLGVENFEGLVDGADAGETVPGDQRVVKERQGQTGDEGMDPDA
jgi:hypothetical protein